MILRCLRKALLLSISAAAATACGGGGGGGGRLANSVPVVHNSAEYRSSYGLASIDALMAYEAGYTGAGVTVGIIDSGIDTDHPDFAGAIHPDSVSMVGGSVDDLGGHGTQVAGVIGARKNDLGMHGVAYDTRLMAVRTDTASSPCCEYSTTSVANGTDYAVANGASILNYSLGYAPGEDLPTAFREALERAVAAGSIIISAAGNDSDSDPIEPAAWAAEAGADGQAVAVGAVDKNNQLAAFSNRAGAVKDYFLVAPGVGIYTTDNDGGFATVHGTSFAAPHVAGAAAILKERFPSLSAKQIVDILFASATDLGAPGTDTTYGRGLLNLDAALQPLGIASVPEGTTAAEGGDPLHETSLQMGAAFGDALAGEAGFGSVLFVDGYDRPYIADLSGAIRPEEAGIDMKDWLSGGRNVTSVAANIGGASLSMAFEEDERDRLMPAGVINDNRFDDARFAFSQGLGAGARATVTQGYDLEGRFGMASSSGVTKADLLGRNAFGAGYLGLVGDGTGVVLDGQIAEGVAYRLGAVSTDGAASAFADEEAIDRTGYVAEVYHHAGGRKRFGLMVGGLEEEGSVLGTTGSAAFGFDDRVSTRFAGLFGAVPAGPVDLFASYTTGWTDASAVSGNLIGGISGLRSDTFSAGAAMSDVVRDGDRLTLALTRPLKVADGTATVDLPVGRTLDGTILRATETVELTPSGNELDAELSYALRLGDDQMLRLNVMTQFEPGHVADADPEVTAGVRYRLKF